MTDTRPEFGSFLRAFGVPAVVTPLTGPAVETEAFWLPPASADLGPGVGAGRAELRRTLVLPLAPAPPQGFVRGTIVTLAEAPDAEPSDWRIDSAERLDADHYRALVVPA